MSRNMAIHPGQHDESGIPENSWVWDGRSIGDVAERIDLYFNGEYDFRQKCAQWQDSVPIALRGEVEYQSHGWLRTLEILAVDVDGQALVYEMYSDEIDHHRFVVMPISEAVAALKELSRKDSDDADRVKYWRWDGRDVEDIAIRLPVICEHFPNKSNEWKRLIPSEYRGEVSYPNTIDAGSNSELRDYFEIVGS